MPLRPVGRGISDTMRRMIQVMDKRRFTVIPPNSVTFLKDPPLLPAMVMRIGGMRRKTRYKLKKEIRQRGKIGLSKYFQSFAMGEKVYLVAEPAVQKGFYHPRFFGKSGVVTGKRGACYHIQISDFGKQKMLIVHPVHLKKVA